MWGRGATDMKASDAALLYLAATLTEPKVDLTYVFYDHEEVVAEKNGLRKVVQAHPEWIQGDFAIIGEPTNCGIEGGCNGTRGRLQRHDAVRRGRARRGRTLGTRVDGGERHPQGRRGARASQRL